MPASPSGNHLSGLRTQLLGRTQTAAKLVCVRQVIVGLSRVTGKPQVIDSSARLVPTNALLVRGPGTGSRFSPRQLEAASNGEEQTQTSPEDGP
jgi:hypothetical protein